MTNKYLGVPLEGFASFSRKVAANGAVLLKNDNQTLPIQNQERIAVFGRVQKDYYRSGTGSGGSVNVNYTTNLIDSLREKASVIVNEDLAACYQSWIAQHPFDDGGGGWAAEPWYQKEMPLSETVVAKAEATSEKAIIVIGRTAGEDQDNANAPGSYLLTADEKHMIQWVTRYFDQVAVVLNTSNIIDMSWLDDSPVQAVIYSWHGGMEGGRAIANLLVGEVTPSGKLTDTIAHSIEDYPSHINHGNQTQNIYQEDIYVGYRYFETFAPEKVRFPFGFGLSYTTFEASDHSARTINRDGVEQIEVEVTVKNTGPRFAGKEVIQVYVEAPQGKLGQPRRALVAFKKTRRLVPGEAQKLLIQFRTDAFKSYDDTGATGYRSAYVLEPGTYFLHVGSSVRDTKRININGKQGYFIEKLQILEQLEEAMAPVQSFQRIKPDQERVNGSFKQKYEEVPVRQIKMADRIKARMPKALKQTGDKGFKLEDVNEGRVTLNDFIAQLSHTDLATIVRGEGMSSPLVTPGTASAFGGVSDQLLHYNIPVACTADGPSGIRMDSGHKATQVPIGTLLAATWDEKLVEELYILEGKELVRNQIDLLLGPGLNLRRHPLNGRNFEYFSEDPLVTGVFAVATARGIKKGGAQVTPKHFACNSQEHERNKVDAVVSERALRQLYLKGFEMVVKEGEALAVMTAYNPINGHWSASNYDLNTTILRGEWGFTGIVMTDWWAQMNDPIDAGKPDRKYTHHMIRAQNDLYMVVNNYGAEVNASQDLTLYGLEQGQLTLGELQRSAANICRALMKLPVMKREHVLEDTVGKITPIDIETGDGDLLHLNADGMVEFKSKPSIVVNIAAPGTYRMFAWVKSSGTDLAQTACHIMINHQTVATVQTNGTDGKWFKQKLQKIELEAGYYQLELEYKPGLEIRAIQFKYM
ncbi:glycoside hydrolase family 3 C-terminal domain-containing protein [Amphibacillus cookii]|uniref:glycoside hydrolase family 3 C-terminal domain-containing protein n=1 Tax=Amphibacillus cookii TaxID=767787 RepID=UPI0019562967|nr:beta-glucosidase [Amphibacillus cookii]